MCVLGGKCAVITFVVLVKLCGAQVAFLVLRSLSGVTYIGHPPQTNPLKNQTNREDKRQSNTPTITDNIVRSLKSLAISNSNLQENEQRTKINPGPKSYPFSFFLFKMYILDNLSLFALVLF